MGAYLFLSQTRIKLRICYCVYAYEYTHTHVRARAHTLIYILVCTRVCFCVNIHIYLYIIIYLTYIYLYVCVYLYICVNLCIYIDIWIIALMQACVDTQLYTLNTHTYNCLMNLSVVIVCYSRYIERNICSNQFVSFTQSSYWTSSSWNIKNRHFIVRFYIDNILTGEYCHDSMHFRTWFLLSLNPALLFSSTKNKPNLLLRIMCLS